MRTRGHGQRHEAQLAATRDHGARLALTNPGGIRGDLAKASSWVIGIVVAEWIIRRPARVARRAARLQVVPS